MRAPVRVLLADDSSLVRAVLTELLEEEGDITVVGAAGDGIEAVSMNKHLAPDLVVLDLDMPVLNGIEAIERMLESRPVPILVVTGVPRGTRGLTALDALRRGALDVLVKPAGWSASDVETLRHRVRTLSRVRVRRREVVIPAAPPAAAPRMNPRSGGRTWRGPPVVGIGTSTGGPPALAELLALLPADLRAAVIIVQHIGVGFDETLARWLDSVCPLPVRVAVPGEAVVGGVVLVAPVGQQLRLMADGTLQISSEARVDGHCPSATVLFQSLATAVGPSALGVLLTGMGRDGAEGLFELRKAGGRTIAQDAATSVVYGMPRAAAELGAAERVMPLSDVPRAIVSFSERR